MYRRRERYEERHVIILQDRSSSHRVGLHDRGKRLWAVWARLWMNVREYLKGEYDKYLIQMLNEACNMPEVYFWHTSSHPYLDSPSAAWFQLSGVLHSLEGYAPGVCSQYQGRLSSGKLLASQPSRSRMQS